MAERVRSLNQISTGGGPAIASIPGMRTMPTSQGIEAAGKTMSAIGERVADIADVRTKDAARRSGERAGLMDQFTRQDPSTIAGAAFNETATQSYVANTEVRTRRRIKELYAEHSAAPDELQQTLNAYLGSQVEAMDEVAPSATEQFRQRFALWTQPFLRRSAGNFRKTAVADLGNTGMDLEHEAIKDLEGSAADLFDDDPGVAQAAAMALGDNLATITRGISTQAMAAGGQIDPVALAAREGQLYSRAVGAGVKAKFQAAPSKADAYLKWRTGGLTMTTIGPDGEPMHVNVANSITPDQRAELDQWMEQELKLHVSSAEQAATMIDKLEADERNRAEFGLWSGVYTDDFTKRATPDQISAAVRNRSIDPQAGREMLNALYSDEKRRDDSTMVNAIENRIYDGTDARKMINRGFADGRITQQTSSRLLSLNQSQVHSQEREDKGPVNRFRKLLHQATQTKGELAIDLGGEPERRAAAMIEYDQLTLQQGMDPREAYDEVLARTKTDIKTLNIRTERMILPRFAVGGRGDLDVNATRMKLRQAAEAGNIGRQELIEEVKRVKEWETALQQTQSDAQQRDAKKRK